MKPLPLITVCLTASLATLACAEVQSSHSLSHYSHQAPNNSDQALSQPSKQPLHQTPAEVDSHLRAVLSQAGIKTGIVSIEPSLLPNLYQVNLAGGQEPLHISRDGRYVIQGTLKSNPSPRRQHQSLPRASSEQVGQPISAALRSSLLANMTELVTMSADTPFYHTAIPGVIWGATEEGVPFLVSDDAQIFSDGEVSVIHEGRFVGLDVQFEMAKNRHVFAQLQEDQLAVYEASPSPAAGSETVLYVATDIHCPYCRLFHQKIPEMNRRGITVKVIDYPVYPESFEPMHRIWCQSGEGRKALLDASMSRASLPALPDCQGNAMTHNRKLASGLAVMATPAIYRADGLLYQGSFDHPEFYEFLGVP